MEETLVLTQEWDKTFPKSDKVDHSKVTFHNRYGITLAADLYKPKGADGLSLIHILLVTDGVTYLWGTEAPKTTYSELANSIATGTDYLNTDYHYRDSSDYNAYSNAKKWMTAHGAEIEAVLANGYEVDCKFDSEERIITNLSKNSGTKYITAGENNPYTALEIATYTAGQAWQDAADEGYNLYAYADQKYTEQYPWGPNFIGGLDTIGGVSGAVPEDTDGMFDGVKNSKMCIRDSHTADSLEDLLKGHAHHDEPREGERHHRVAQPQVHHGFRGGEHPQERRHDGDAADGQDNAVEHRQQQALGGRHIGLFPVSRPQVKGDHLVDADAEADPHRVDVYKRQPWLLP